MSDATTNSQSDRYETLKAGQTFTRLAQHPHMQAEAIAGHYLKLAHLAMETKNLVDFRRYRGGGESIDQLIDHHVATIRKCHREDFGIDLEWETPEPQ